MNAHPAIALAANRRCQWHTLFINPALALQIEHYSRTGTLSVDLCGGATKGKSGRKGTSFAGTFWLVIAPFVSRFNSAEITSSCRRRPLRKPSVFVTSRTSTSGRSALASPAEYVASLLSAV